MPPRTRGTKGTKILKENLVAVDKTKSKTVGKIAKPPRKALADKTNSASDDNTSLEIKKKVNQKHVDATEIENMPRPRRERRLPTRFVGNNVLKNLSSSKKQPKNKQDVSQTTKQSPIKVNTTIESPFKTPQKDLENSLVANRPKRLCRLPSKFEDHSISPSKFIPLKPCHASTPILEHKSSKVTEKSNKMKQKKLEPAAKPVLNKNIAQKRHIEHSPEVSSDTNNNAKRRLVRHKNTVQELNMNEKVSPRISKKVPISLKGRVNSKLTRKITKKVTETGFSFRVLEDKRKSSQNSQKGDLDVYEFTYDPKDEPPPAKKKRKRTVKKKPAQPKTVVFKNNYDKNVAKALVALKNAVAKKPDAPQVINPTALPTATVKVDSRVPQNNNNVVEQVAEQKLPQNTAQISKEIPQAVNNSTTASKPVDGTNPVELQNYNSVRVEDIAADFEIDDYNDINYSPVNSPQRPKTPVQSNQTLECSLHNNDPLNLRGDLSFFDDNPVASSSMNISSRHPQASPWRVEFNNLPIKWQANTYVKPDMTPAVESSFINSEDNKKKHVYTNMIEHNDAPEVVQNQSNLKQTSIISFIREVVEKSAQKKKRGRSVTPTKANNNNLFDDLQKGESKATPKKVDDKSGEKVSENVLNSSEKSENYIENSKERSNKKQTKTSKDKDGTFFGFDDSEDQENVSPVKIDNPRVRAFRARSRAVLQEINAMSGPMRALPLAAKSKIAASSDAVNKVYEEIKSAADAPVIPEKTSMQKSSEGTLVDEGACDVDIYEDSHSVHLFEDIELVHHLKPTRKSYGKAKKVTFRQHSTSNETLDVHGEQDPVSSEEDDLADLTFTMPTFQPQKKAKKKKSKKQKMSKKEQKAMEEWAAGFNSMCEDIEDVPLIVE